MKVLSKISDDFVEEFQDSVLRFYETKGRTLPWRETTNHYHILISEMMLQQTQVSRVIPKYYSFIHEFPTPQLLAKKPLRKVLELWQGLGYNRRAKYLQESASIFINNPQPSYEELLSLKGVGEYTANAVRIFGSNDDRSAIDVNIRRLFKRFFGSVNDDFIRDCVPSGKSREWHNALMDFGAQICTKKAPKCSECPLQSSCYAFINDTFGGEPIKSQGTFIGSIRWHRGQIIKFALKGVSRDEAWEFLGEHRNEECFLRAVNQLFDEGLIIEREEMFVVP